jgi:hypothetical protein
VAKTSGRESLDHAIAAAGLYMKAAAEARSSSDRARLRRKCEELITYAEKLKVAQLRGRPSTDQTHCQMRLIPPSEEAIILQSSRLHGSVFPPWQSEPGQDRFQRSKDGAFFT